MTEPRIPIQNLYYLLCYAWNHLKQGELVDVSRVPTTNMADLFAVVLCDGIQHLARRGLEQGYELHEEELIGARGRIDMLGSERRFLAAHGRALCRFDEITVNTINNQILKSTLRRLANTPDLNKELRERVYSTHRKLHGINDISLTKQNFKLVQLHSNNRFYRFLINVCEMVRDYSLVDQASGTYKFRDFQRDERAMARVFQDFLFNFIRTEIPSYNVKQNHIKWLAESEGDPELSLLPRMATDISLRHGKHHIIIDAKYYRNALSSFYETEKLHSANLYQLMSYLTNTERHGDVELSGMLIYPRVDKTLRQKYKIQGYPVTICTVDLNQDWKDIRAEIFEIVDMQDTSKTKPQSR
jgi:5-methylcytosine-specific restriction enzyme subunit McrC